MRIRNRTWVRLALESLDPRLSPAVFTWTAGGTTNNFSDANNWAGKAVPVLDGTAELMFPAANQLKTGTAGLLAINNLAGADGTTTFQSLTFMDSYQIEDVDAADTSSLTMEVAQAVAVMAGTVTLDTQLMLPGGSKLSVNGNSLAVASLRGSGTVDVGTGRFAIADLNGAAADPATDFTGEIGGTGTFSIAHTGSAALGGLLSLGGPTAHVEVEGTPSIFFNGTISPPTGMETPVFDVQGGFLAFSGATLPSDFVPGTTNDQATWDFSDFTTNTVTLAGLTGKGITISGNSDVILDGKAKQKTSIGKVSGLGTLTMNGQGTQTIDSIQLSSAFGTIVTINNGTLLLNGSADGGQIELNNGTLGGTVIGDVGLQVRAFSFGAIAPGGTGAIGSLRFDQLDMPSFPNPTTPSFQIDIAGAAAGEFDQLVMAGAAEGNAFLEVDVLEGTKLVEQQQITIVSVLPTGLFYGSFSNVAFGEEFNSIGSGYRFRLDRGPNGNDVVLTVVSTPPEISAIANQTQNVDTILGPISFTLTDSITPSDQISVLAFASNTTLVPSKNIQIGGSGENRTISITPATGQTGSSTITIVATDGDGLSSNGTFEVTFQNLPPPPPPANTPPVAVNDAATTRFQTAVLISVLANDTDADGHTLGIVSTTVPANGDTNIVGTQLLYIPRTGFTGTDSFNYTIGDGKGGSSTAKVTVTVGPPPSVGPQLIGFPQFAAGSDVGGSAVTIFNPDGSPRVTATPFPGFTGGVRTAAADFNNDGVADIVAGTGPGRATRVVVLDGVTLTPLFSVDPFEPSFTGGVYVAAGDVNGDGVADLAITPDEGGGPRVDIYAGNGFARIVSFFGIDDVHFRGGARSAIADLTGDGVSDLVVVAGFGGGPRVAAFDGLTLTSSPRKIFGDFFAFEQTLRNGIFVTAGDLNGDGFADLIAGGGPGGGPRVLVFDGRSLLNNQIVPLANFFGGDPNSRGGIRLAVKNLDGDSKADLVVGSGSGAGARVTAYLGVTTAEAGTPPGVLDFDVFAGFTGGVFVG